MSERGSDYLIWIDLEMTGLYPEHDRIIEIATVITDSKDLKVVAEGPVLAIHQSNEIMWQMNDWCKDTHNKSGLVTRVQNSRVTEQEAERKTIEFLSQYLDAKVSPMCGNSVWQDRRFLAKYMPQLEAFFHYRLIDVSTLKELARRWRPDLFNSFVKETKHEALSDILESIDELKFYREHFLKETI
jgi:oligoribonuclease